MGEADGGRLRGASGQVARSLEVAGVRGVCDVFARGITTPVVAECGVRSVVSLVAHASLDGHTLTHTS